VPKDDSTGGSHEKLWDFYSRNQDSTECVELAKLGGRMKTRRVKADYLPHVNRISDEVKDSLEFAEECIATSSIPSST
jgi:hypothetical protein